MSNIKKCKDCEHSHSQKSSNFWNKQKHNYYQCLYPVRDYDGAILMQKSVRSITSIHFNRKCPDWCPLNKH